MQAVQYLRPTLYITCFFTLVMAAAMLIPAAVDLYDRHLDWQVFVASAAVVAGLSILGIVATRHPMPRFTVRFGFLMTTVLWVVTAIVCALPFYFSEVRITFAEAVFESMSGLTTTGSTILVGLDRLPRGILLWRAMLQGIGGIGIIAIGLFLFPFLRIGGMQLFRTESSDRSDKIMPRMIQITAALCGIYLGLIFLCAFAYAVLGMTPFDAITHALATVSTGGVSTHDASFGAFDSPAILWVASFFMMTGGVPLILLIGLAFHRRTALFRDVQVRTFFGIIVFSSLALALWRWWGDQHGFFDALTHATFNVVSVVTTTGFVSQDYTVWGPLSVGIFFFLTFVGGCSGSTAGGIKIYRLVILWQALSRSVQRLLYPNSVVPMRYGDRVVEPEVFESVVVFLIAFVGLIVVMSLLLCTVSGLDLMTSLSGVATAFCNVGPGIGPLIGPAGTFAPLDDFATVVLTVAMLLGRLEIMTVLVLFTGAFWRS
ncbi:trk system potassium uptake protein TrkH [Pseudoxanthobacter soli DSM 19599]|uniref:Trk system potassium uptake protein n=1 Tax=Pseudoxanthobacter soli DSM 19599 TaxID=1123029 RepID=A0A1M7ZDM4_9HYPH|nr:TrkH family potassium uptake protein [Pseudoxanthobacter soli]SHO62776.1 trk system potassium uptake protein TrkH [Pseudoxanthobacter soli DSM 19599]